MLLLIEKYTYRCLIRCIHTSERRLQTNLTVPQWTLANGHHREILRARQPRYADFRQRYPGSGREIMIPGRKDDNAFLSSEKEINLSSILFYEKL